MNSKFNLNKRNILITGATGNLGREICKKLASLDANLILIDLNLKKLENLKKKLTKKNNIKIRIFKCNFLNKDEIINFCIKIKKEKIRIDTIINNAAFTGGTDIKGWNTHFKNQSYETFTKALTVNLSSIFLIIKELKTSLHKSKFPCIINIASIYSILAPDYKMYKDTNIFNPAAYGASKAGLVHLTKWLATTLAPKIRCNSISLGGIKGGQKKLFIKRYINKVPMGRMAKADDLINAIIFLSSELSSYITGQNLIIDGGLTIK